jgi:hypothetical protein
MDKMLKLISVIQSHPDIMSPDQIEKWLGTLRTLKGVRVQELTPNTVRRCKEGSLRCIIAIYFGDIAEMSVILDRVDYGKYSVKSDVFFYSYNTSENNLKQQHNNFMNHIHEQHMRQSQQWHQQQGHRSLMNHIHEHQRFVHEHMHQHHVMMHHHHNF